MVGKSLNTHVIAVDEHDRDFAYRRGCTSAVTLWGMDVGDRGLTYKSLTYNIALFKKCDRPHLARPGAVRFNQNKNIYCYYSPDTFL